MTHTMIYTILVVCNFIFGIITYQICLRKSGRTPCVGDIVIIKSQDKTTFSLEVDDFLERIEHEKEVKFRVKVSNDESNREQN